MLALSPHVRPQAGRWQSSSAQLFCPKGLNLHARMGNPFLNLRRPRRCPRSWLSSLEVWDLGMMASCGLTTTLHGPPPDIQSVVFKWSAQPWSCGSGKESLQFCACW